VLRCQATNYQFTVQQNVLLACGPAASVSEPSAKSGDCTAPQPPGAFVRYRCKEHFTPLALGIDGLDGDSQQEHELICGPNGTWSKGISRFNSFFCVEDCGHRKINPKPLIINGVRTERISWPWHVIIFRRSVRTHKNETSTLWSYICGSSIVHNSIVLTAAHCVTTMSGVGLPAVEFKVALGAVSSNLSLNLFDPTVQILSVKLLYYIYEAYDPKKDYQADITILHLESGMTFNDYVLPVCLPRDSVLEVDALRPGSVGQVAGFGIDEPGNVSPYLKYGELLVKSRQECFARRNSARGTCRAPGGGTVDVHMQRRLRRCASFSQGCFGKVSRLWHCEFWQPS
jgi:hypothetical protein